MSVTSISTSSESLVRGGWFACDVQELKENRSHRTVSSCSAGPKTWVRKTRLRPSRTGSAGSPPSSTVQKGRSAFAFVVIATRKIPEGSLSCERQDTARSASDDTEYLAQTERAVLFICSARRNVAANGLPASSHHASMALAKSSPTLSWASTSHGNGKSLSSSLTTSGPGDIASSSSRLTAPQRRRIGTASSPQSNWISSLAGVERSGSISVSAWQPAIHPVAER